MNDGYQLQRLNTQRAPHTLPDTSAEMSIRAKSHTDLQAAGTSSLLESSYKSLSMSSSNVNRGARFGNHLSEDGKATSRLCRRPVRAVRPLSANGSFLQISQLQGELVRKRKECEDLKKENKFLANEIHMERIVMRSENELTMRNLRNMNQELQAHVRELKQKVQQSLQRAALCSRAAEEADVSRLDAEKSRALAEAQAVCSQREKRSAEAEQGRLSDELQLLKKQHTELQLSLAQTEKSYFETKLQLERVSGEKQAALQENRSLELHRGELEHRVTQLTQENTHLKDSEASLRRRVLALEDECRKASRAQQDVEAERRQLEKENQETTSECLKWRSKHQQLSEQSRAEEERRAQRESRGCQANIKSFFLCMTESDQRVRILKNPDGSPRNFTEGDPVYISSSESGPDEPERCSSRTLLRVAAPQQGRDSGASHFDELPAFDGERPKSAPGRRSRKVVDYFWIPTDQE